MEPSVVLSLLGTRPEAIKLAPVLRALEARADCFTSRVALTGQHSELVDSLIGLLDIRVDCDLKLMRPGQTPTQIAHRVLEALDPVLEKLAPDLVLVQGDTTSAMAGALAAFHRGIPVGHVEAGLRTGDSRNPFPEEVNRRLITSLADMHFAATPRNRETLIAEGVRTENIFVTGNPVVDSLDWVLENRRPSRDVQRLLDSLSGYRPLILTTHRRESFGQVMQDNLRALRAFVERHDDVRLIFPVHPNPNVREISQRELGSQQRVHLLDPLDYPDFAHLLSHAWLIVSDSGGLQEEAPSLGKPLLVLRKKTERPEVLTSGIARLVTGGAEGLSSMLEEAYSDGSWASRVCVVTNPFGDGASGERIVDLIRRFLVDPERP